MRAKRKGVPMGPNIGRLRDLSPPLRYLAYVAGALLLVLVAVGVGATAAVLVGGGHERAMSGSGGAAGSGATEGTVQAKTGEARNANPDGTSSGRNADVPASEITFIHTATAANCRGDYTYLSSPSIDADPNAIVLVTQASDRESTGSATYEHNIGVWYAPGAQKWAIFDQDRAAVPRGATFEVTVPPASEKFVHHAELNNTAGNSTYLDDPLTNGNPDAVLSVTQNWNPGGSRGVYNNHPTGVLYDKVVKKWAIYNRDDAPIPDGAAFNVAVSGRAKPGS
jgi:hypothetical protein